MRSKYDRLGCLNVSGDAFKVMRRKINVNEGTGNRIVKAEDTFTSFPVEAASANDGEAAERGIDIGAKPRFAEQDNVITVE